MSYNATLNSANITAQGRGSAFAPLQSQAVQYPARPSLTAPGMGSMGPGNAPGGPPGGMGGMGMGGGMGGPPNPMMPQAGAPPGSVAPGGGPMPSMAGGPDGAFAVDPTLLRETLQGQPVGASGVGGEPGAFGVQQQGGARPTLMGGGNSGFGARVGNNRQAGSLGGAFAPGFGRR